MKLSEFIRVFDSFQYKEKSALWADLSSALKANLSEVLEADPKALLRVIDDFGERLHYSFYFSQSTNLLSEELTHVREIRKSVGRQLKQIHANCESNMEDVGSYVFLDSIGWLDEYLELAQRLSFKPDMSSARHFYYARRLKDIFTERNLPPARVLEIGAGAANLNVLLRHFGLVSDYTIIDLPEMLLISAANLEIRFGYQCRMMELPSADAVDNSNYMVAASPNLLAFQPDSFDLILNFNSFSEMLPEVVTGYFETIYKTSRDGALFVNVNRVQQHKQPDGVVFDMNPLLFPYATTDQILVWDVDLFQQFVRQFCRPRPVKTTAIMRVGIIRRVK